MKAQRIAIDCRFASTLGGLGTYTRSLVTSLVSSCFDVQFVLFVKDAHEEWLSAFSSFSHVRCVPFSSRHYSLLEQIIFPFLLWKEKCSLLFVPHFNVPLFAPLPIVMTVHDCILHRFPNTHSLFRRMAYRFLFFLAMLRAKKITTVTESTKSDLLHYYPWRDPASLVVIYPGIPVHSAPPSSVHPRSFLPSLADRYFLYVGNAKEHKNVSFLIDAFIKAELTGIDLVLVMNGKEALSLPHFSHIHFFSGLSETHLLALYRHSLACVTASQLEGFCLPVIEAMNERTRVLAPSIPPFPEVCEGHAHLVSLSLDSFSTGFQMIAAESPEERTKALDTAHIFVKRYSWKKAAEEVRGMLTEEAEEK